MRRWEMGDGNMGDGRGLMGAGAARPMVGSSAGGESVGTASGGFGHDGVTSGVTGAGQLAFLNKGSYAVSYRDDVMAKTYDQHLHESLAYLSLPALASHSAWSPNTDVYETPESLVVKMEIAGISKDDLEITLNDRLLLVRGHRKDPCRQRRCSFRQMEIDYGQFERRIVIPRSVDGSRVRAQFQNGFLHIELPKSQKSEHATVTVIIDQAG